MKFLTWIVEWSLANRVLVIIATILFILFGIDSTMKLKVDAIPDVTTIQVQVITTAPALSPTEIEQYVTFPVERSMAGIPYLEEIRSISRHGLSVVTIVFKDHVNIYLARQLVGERLGDAVKNIPMGYGMPVMGPISTGLGEIFQFTVSSDRMSTMDITTYLNWYINPLLKTVPGVVEVNTFGGETKQYQVVVNLEKMQSLGIVIADVIEALQKNNAAMGGGYIEHNKEHYVIATNGLVGSLTDLENIYIGKTKEGTPIRLSSIAELKNGKKLRLGAVTKDGKGEVVGAMTLMLMKENSLKVTQSVKDKLEEIKKILPEGMTIDPFYDRSAMVNATIKTVVKNLIEGALLVIVVLFLLLGSIRAGLVIAAIIPLAMLFAIACMKSVDSPGNLMSMGAIDFGLLVDGAVIIVENAVRRLSMAIKEKGRQLTEEEKIEVIKEATIEVRKATIFGETIIAIVYIPILSLSGVEGKMFFPMAETVLFALLGAFILSLSVVPVLATFLLKVEDPEEHETWFFHKLKTMYEPVLALFLRKKQEVIYGGIAMIVGSFILFFNLGAEFMPELDEGSMLIESARLPSVSLKESTEMTLRVEDALLKNFPEVLHAISKTGSPDIATDPMGMDRSDVYLVLKPKEEWRFPKDKLVKEIEQTLTKYVPEIAPSVSMPIKMRTNELIAGIRSDIGIKVFGDNLNELKKIGDEVAETLRTIEGAEDLKIEQLEGLNYLRINPNREKLVRYGANITDINQVTESLSSGYEAGNVFEGFKRFSIMVKIDKTLTSNPEEIRMVPVRTSQGISVPLGDLADVYIESGPVQISHENQYRRMLIEFNVRGKDMMTVVSEAQDKLGKLKLPPGYRIEYGGKYKNYLSARNTLMIVVPLTLCVILFILWLAFGKLTPAMMIFTNVPFAITGGVFFLFLRGIPFSISAGVGFVALFGVAVLNGLVLISFTKELEEHGKSHAEAVNEAAHLRLRPVLMTAIVAITGFIPMALSTSMGAEVQRPLATVVIGGLITAAALTLLVLPVVYTKYYEWKK